MNAKIAQCKKITIALIGALLLGLVLLTPPSVPARAADDFDAAAFYKAKCAMCHGASAEKKYDPSIPEDQQVEVVLKGKEGTPKMPGFEKSLNAEQAKALVTFMKSLKK